VQLVHVATQGPLGWAAVSAARRLALPVTCDFRTNFHQYAHYYGLGWIAPLVQSYLRRFHARARLNFVPTGETLRDLSQVGFERLRVVGRGVDTQRFGPHWRSEALRREWQVGAEPVMLYVGRVAAEKNVGLALRSFRAARRLVPRLSMVVVGDGPLRPSLQTAFPDVRFVGPLRGDTLARHYASADLFTFPSLSDTFGNVTMEALASGLPVVAFNTAAAGQHVEDGVSGHLVRRGDDTAFIDAVCELARRHPRLEPMRVAARAAAQHADWDSVMLAFEQHLADAVNAQPARTPEAVALA
jgi:glycosyltransferase involved in cell wall biosynthesis